MYEVSYFDNCNCGGLSFCVGVELDAGKRGLRAKGKGRERISREKGGGE